MSTLSARPGHGRICRIEIGATHAPYPPAQIIPALRNTLDTPGSEDDVVKAVRKVDVVLPHSCREYATGLILTVRDADVARGLATTLLQVAQMLDQEVALGALDSLDAAENVTQAAAPHPAVA